MLCGVESGKKVGDVEVQEWPSTLDVCRAAAWSSMGLRHFWRGVGFEFGSLFPIESTSQKVPFGRTSPSKNSLHDREFYRELGSRIFGEAGRKRISTTDSRLRFGAGGAANEAQLPAPSMPLALKHTGVSRPSASPQSTPPVPSPPPASSPPTAPPSFHPPRSTRRCSTPIRSPTDR